VGHGEREIPILHSDSMLSQRLDTSSGPGTIGQEDKGTSYPYPSPSR